MELIEKQVKQYVAENVRCKVQADGGEISFISFENNLLTLKLEGECSRCPLTENCFKDWLVQEIENKFNIKIKTDFVIKKPYFWDKAFETK